ncbi:MAG TPA: ABC transporter permease subunit [Polyangiaceae bacterium]|nr:ABC transporter permease subunit [Polyangiaceae bacterium]
MSFSRLIEPNRVTSRGELRIVAAVWLGISSTWWASSASGVLPKPVEVLRALRSLLFEQGLLAHLSSSLYTSLLALAWASTLSALLCYSAVLPAFRPLSTLVGNLRFWGFAGVSVAFTLWFHGGRDLKVALLTFGMTGFFVTGLHDELRVIPRERYDYARALGMNEWRVAWEVVVLGTCDRFLDLMRQNAAMGWMLLTMVEALVRSDGGIGVLLANQSKHLDLASIAALQGVIFGVGLLQDLALASLKRVLCPWAFLKVENQSHGLSI